MDSPKPPYKSTETADLKKHFEIALEAVGGRSLTNFKNYDEELFLFYTIPTKKGMFVTGDRLRWEFGWLWNDGRPRKYFILSAGEKQRGEVAYDEAKKK